MKENKQDKELVGMVSGKVRIKNPTGLHLRPAGLFCKTAMQFESKITVHKKGKIGRASCRERV